MRMSNSWGPNSLCKVKDVHKMQSLTDQGVVVGVGGSPNLTKLVAWQRNICSPLVLTLNNQQQTGIKIFLFGQFNFFSFFLSFFFLGPPLRHMEVPRLGVSSELQLPAYATATATLDPSHICDLHHSSRQRRSLNPLSKTRDRTRNLMVPSLIHFRCAMMGTPWIV